MKVAPVSGDLLVKLALAVAVLGGAYILTRRAIDSLPSWDLGLSDYVDRFGDAVSENVIIPAQQVGRGVALNFTQPANERADVYTTKPPTTYGGKYANPLINDDGMNFGYF